MVKGMGFLGEKITMGRYEDSHHQPLELMNNKDFPGRFVDIARKIYHLSKSANQKRLRLFIRIPKQFPLSIPKITSQLHYVWLNYSNSPT